MIDKIIGVGGLIAMFLVGAVCSAIYVNIGNAILKWAGF